MFHSARLKLTAWYLCIITLICIAFSVAVYGILIREVKQFASQQRSRFEHRLYEGVYVPNQALPFIQPGIPADTELIEQVRMHIINTLIATDVSILVMAGIAAYILAGRTLQPIKVMVNEQKRFIGDASHELRTPLTALKSAMEVHLRDKALTVKDSRLLLTQAIVEVNKLQSLSDELLQLTQYEQPNGHTPMQLIDLKKFTTHIVQKFTPIAKQKKMQIIHTVDPVTVQAYEKHLDDLYSILLDNAIKYSADETTITLKTTGKNERLHITCTNTGVGITRKDLPYIFDRFYRADTARSKKNADGYGLGLSIAQGIVRLYNGSISVKSKPGKETTFTVSLPLKIVAA